MKTPLTIAITAAVTWFIVSLVHTGRSAVERLGLISAVKVPGGMALSEILTDKNGGHPETAKAKREILLSGWWQFDTGHRPFEGPGIGDIMVAFGKPDPAAPLCLTSHNDA